MLDMMRKTIDRNLLKYSAGQHIFCPQCQKVADYRTWLIIESPTGKIFYQGCADHVSDSDQSGLIDLGYKIIKESGKREPAQVPQKPGKALDTWLRKTIDRSHAREDKANNCAGHGRLFPIGSGCKDWPMLEITGADGTVTIDYQGDPHFSKLQIDAYVAQFCKLNHLK